MWQVRTFKTAKALEAWIEANRHCYQIERVFIHNGYAAQYRKLRVVY